MLILFLSRILHPFREILRELSSAILTVNMICLFVSVTILSVLFDIFERNWKEWRVMKYLEKKCCIFIVQKSCFGVNMLRVEIRWYLYDVPGGGGVGRSPFIVVCYFKTEVNDACQNPEMKLSDSVLFLVCEDVNYD